VLRSTTKQSRSGRNKRIARSAKPRVVLPKNYSARVSNKRQRPARRPNVRGDQLLLRALGGVWPTGTALTRWPTLQQERRTHSLARMGFYSLISDFCPAVGQSSRTEPLHFYEKVIKVKADVAAFLINCFPFHLSICITLRW
jgi:hypothetical protein